MIAAKYYEVALPDVMRYFAAGFIPKEGVMAADIPPEWFVDVGRGVVVFKLFIETGEVAPVKEESAAEPYVTPHMRDGEVYKLIHKMRDEGKLSVRFHNSIVRNLDDRNSKSVAEFVAFVRSGLSVKEWVNFKEVGQAALIKALDDYGL